MAALEIDCTTLSLPLGMGRTSNGAGDESQKMIHLACHWMRRKNGTIMSGKNSPAVPRSWPSKSRKGTVVLTPATLSITLEKINAMDA